VHVYAHNLYNVARYNVRKIMLVHVTVGKVSKFRAKTIIMFLSFWRTM